MAQIELSEFITNVLIQIASGVRGANEHLRNPDKNQFEVFSLRQNIGDSSTLPGIKFDVAVSAESQQKEKAGFFVALASIGGGANTEASLGNQLTHRIQFEVGIADTWK